MQTQWIAKTLPIFQVLLNNSTQQSGSGSIHYLDLSICLGWQIVENNNLVPDFP